MGVSDGWVEVGDQVFVRRYEFFDQNIGLILGRAEALVIDTRSTYAQAREIQDHVRELTDSPIGVVVDTHGHFDHAFGNAVFRPATIWGHERCVSFMVRTGERRKVTIGQEEPAIADELREIVIDPPDRVFATHATVEVGGREVDLRFLGRGHTDHDILIDIPGTDVVFGGDLVENGNVPFFNDGYPLEWPATLDALAARVGSGVVVVPGHGDHGGKAFLDAQRESVSRLADLARRVEGGELTLDDGVAQHPFPEHPAEDARRGFERALAQIRGELDRVDTSP
ncbi:MAG: MBL fold metallo-hydrolase [Chloroflexota bacterium]|jgi:glyoxylase-like metal-dependent hydrolase (beta-lactamase superfamily II)